MSLDLDDRQRAMLAEMGVHVWWPQSTDADEAEVHQAHAAEQAQCAIESIAVYAGNERAGGQKHINSAVSLALPVVAGPEPVATPSQAVSTPVARRPLPAPLVALPASPTALLPLADGIAGMDWPMLRKTVNQCQACAMCLGRRAPVLAAPPISLRADWMIVGEPPDDAQERAGQPFVDDAGKLLNNMLKAVGVKREEAYLSHVLKCRPALPTAPDAQALAACANYLQREIALVQPKVILAMGRMAMQVLLSQDHPQGLKLPLAKLRGQVWRYQGVPVVVTYPPAYLLRSGQDKARAWEDLCFALDVVQGQA